MNRTEEDILEKVHTDIIKAIQRNYEILEQSGDNSIRSPGGYTGFVLTSLLTTSLLTTFEAEEIPIEIQNKVLDNLIENINSLREKQDA